LTAEQSFGVNRWNFSLRLFIFLLVGETKWGGNTSGGGVGEDGSGETGASLSFLLFQLQ